MRASKYLPADLNARIDGGICFYKGEPFIIEHASDKTAHLYELSRETPLAHQNIPLNSTDLDISSPKLGYMNTKDSAVYWWRRPDRRYKQTLSHGSLNCEYVLTRTLADPASLRVWMYTEDFKNMLMDKYPSVDEAFTRLSRPKVVGVAISRNVALGMDSFGVIRVYFKQKFVGSVKDLHSKVVDIPKGEDAWVISKYLSNFSWVVN